METKVQKGNPLQFFTIAARNYLANAFVLGESVMRTHPDTAFSIFLMDDLNHEWKCAIEARGFGVIYPEDIPLANYRKFVFQYNITEASTGVKPSIFQMLFTRDAQKVIYLDPDILCFRRFDEVLTALDQCSIVLTPHICSPAPEDYFPGERTLLNSGVFNLGFLALCADKTSEAFLKWWAHHLAQDCIQESETGLFVDQKWVDLVPECFDGVYVMRNAAYNIAYWNLHERELEQRAGDLHEVRSGERVAFIHFSGFTIEDLKSICKYAARNPFGDGTSKKRHTLTSRPDLAATFTLYRDLLLSADIENLQKAKYGYATYENGELISDLERSLYRTSSVWKSKDVDPFGTARGSFREACRRTGIRDLSDRNLGGATGDSAENYGGYIRVIRFFLKFCVRILGPRKYLQFAKFMRHQLLPSNHGFLLNGGSLTVRTDVSSGANSERRSADSGQSTKRSRNGVEPS